MVPNRKAVNSMHQMMMEETIRARKEELSKVATNNHFVALARGEHPSRATKIRNALKAMSARSDEKIRKRRIYALSSFKARVVTG